MSEGFSGELPSFQRKGLPAIYGRETVTVVLAAHIPHGFIGTRPRGDFPANSCQYENYGV